MSVIKCVSSELLSPVSSSLLEYGISGTCEIVFDEASNSVFISNRFEHIITMIDIETCRLSKIAGVVGSNGYVDGSGENVRFNWPRGLAYIKRTKCLIVADTGNTSIRSVYLDGNVSTISCNPETRYFENMAFPWSHPHDIVIGSDGHIIVSDCSANSIVSINQDKNTVSILSGGKRGHKDGHVSVAQFNCPCGLAISHLGDIYICDTYNDCIRLINSQKIVSTISYPNQKHLRGGLIIVTIKNPSRIKIRHGDIFFSEGYGVIKALHSAGVVFMSDSQMSLSGFTFLDDNTIIAADAGFKTLRKLIVKTVLPKIDEEEKLEDKP